MYRKSLIPLDGSKEVEGVFPLMRGELADDGEVILLQVVPRARTQVVGGHVIPTFQQEEAALHRAETYCNLAFREHAGDPDKWRCEVTVNDSVSDGIVGFAVAEGVDLIGMYTHDRKGLGALIKKSIAKDVRRKAPIEVKIFKPQEVAALI